MTTSHQDRKFLFCCNHEPIQSLKMFLISVFRFLSETITQSSYWVIPFHCTGQNTFGRYSTNGITGFVVRELGRKSDVPVDEFVVRNDCPCGSTIGPIMSARTGIRVVDAGMPQLSMHSCREVMGTADLTYGKDIFLAFYKHFRTIDENLGETVCAICP